jgi:uncharacterized protein involved in type VI secretion and phage assembly
MNDSSNDRLAELMLDRHYGKFRATIVDNNDPENRGRLKVNVPCVMDNECFWALPCSPFGGKEAGIFMVPENESALWVEFEGGDPSRPIWTGCYWPDDHSPKDNSVSTPDVRLIKSVKGMLLALNDSEETVTISDKQGNNVITIDVNGGTIRIKGSSSIVIDSGTVKLGGDTAIESVVHGTTLNAFLQTMVTTLQSLLGPTIPPVPPTLLSTVVTTA